MGVTWGAKEPMTGDRATERLFLSRDGKSVVSEDDPQAFVLIAAPGDPIPERPEDFMPVSLQPARPAQAEANAEAAKSDAAADGDAGPEPAERDDVPAAGAEADTDTKARHASANKAKRQTDVEDK